MEKVCSTCASFGSPNWQFPCKVCENFDKWMPNDAMRQAENAKFDLPQAEGVKLDDGKPRYDLYPPEALAGAVEILTFGAGKYGDRNWEQGMRWGRVFRALMSHMWAWWGGESLDPETGKSHLHHAACCIAFLQAYEARAIGQDDRPSSKKKV